MKNKQIIEMLEEHKVEYLQCPYCGCKLERVKDKDKNNTWLKPTSCIMCNKHGIVPNMKNVVFIGQIRELLKC